MVEVPIELIEQLSITFHCEELFPFLLVCKRWYKYFIDRYTQEVKQDARCLRKIRLFSVRTSPFTVLYWGAKLVSNHGFTMEAIVRPVELGHEVGIVYTKDEWKTVEKSSFTWTGNDGKGQETWHIYFPLHIFGGNETKFWFAIWAKCDNGTVWDNNVGWNHEFKVKAESLNVWDGTYSCLLN